MNRIQRYACLGMPLVLAACATVAPPDKVEALAPKQWQAPLPHDGKPANLTQWWQQQGDPLLAQLIDAAQAASPSIAAAKTRIAQARAERIAAGAGLLPSLDATADATRSNGQPPLIPTNTTLRRGFQTAWELDVFGANRANWRAARLRHEAAQAGWHEARVSVAAETANLYVNLRTCQQLLRILQSDAESRRETARLSELTAKAGFLAPATAALARAGLAESRSRALQQEAQCDSELKSLVALTAMPEPALRDKLAAPAAPMLTPIAVDKLPAAILAQRPDIFAAEAQVAAAAANIDAAQAARFPRLGLSGFIGRTTFSAAGVDSSFETWSIGPLAVTLPIFDGGRRSAAVDAAQAGYEEAVTQYRAQVRQAVREVEQALINLAGTAARSGEANTAVEGYRASLDGIEARYKSGLTSLLDLEDARRLRLAAEIALANLQRERIGAWIALYRALGGGWSRDQADVAATKTAHAPAAQ